MDNPEKENRLPIDERIISVSKSLSQSNFMTIASTYNLFFEKHKNGENFTIDVTLYLRDIYFLLGLVTAMDAKLEERK